MLTREFYEGHQVRPGRLEAAIFRLAQPIRRLVGTRVDSEGIEGMPAEPVLLATNASHRHDFLLMRQVLLSRGVGSVVFSKPKNYHGLLGILVRQLGTIPLVSRGYLILSDFVSRWRRRPTEEEYRILRDHLDQGVGVPDREPFTSLMVTPREILGNRFVPSQEPWRECLRRLYREALARSLSLAREALQAGYHLHIYPQGTVAADAAPGRIGAVQIAWALGLPLVPAGLNGARDIFLGDSPAFFGGHGVVRFGRPYHLAQDLLPAEFVPFDPQHEERYRPRLQEATDELMRRIGSLLDESARGPEPGPSRGTRAFL
ncbi:MAG: 1-acyl-sn-glycerol-3-phosphate acyltransferase [Candidatus Wallbacteria bacterium]|nr:1-acyl-sn-glycerol-3-phosphate acyltransferase [Candidatus Wallbacteria bacterium]